jgi:hypothetical protein
MTNVTKQPTIRVADADESPVRIDYALIDRKYKEWLVRRGFSDELGNALGMRRPNKRRSKAIDHEEL